MKEHNSFIDAITSVLDGLSNVLVENCVQDATCPISDAQSRDVTT